MLALLGTSIGKYLLIAMCLLALVGSGALYVWYTSSQITSLTSKVAALNAEATDLQAANSAMAKDIANVQQAQTQANQKLETIRVQSAQTAQRIRKQVLNTSNPQALQDQVNKDTANTFSTLEQLSQP